MFALTPLTVTQARTSRIRTQSRRICLQATDSKVYPLLGGNDSLGYGCRSHTSNYDGA